VKNVTAWEQKITNGLRNKDLQEGPPRSPILMGTKTKEGAIQDPQIINSPVDLLALL
jgi:hypothetical protein